MIEQYLTLAAVLIVSTASLVISIDLMAKVVD